MRRRIIKSCILVKGILKTYSACNSQAIDVDIIQKDLSVAGIGETLIQTLMNSSQLAPMNI